MLFQYVKKLNQITTVFILIHGHGEDSKKENLNAMDELEISKNGPSDFRAEKLLVVEMDKYWKKNRDNGISHGNQLRP